MKKSKLLGKLFLASFLITLFVVLLTVSTAAATHEVTTEAELITALNNAVDGDTVKTTKDITLTQAITLNKNITIESTGQKITTSTLDALFSVNANVIFKNAFLSNTKAGACLFKAGQGQSGSVQVTCTATSISLKLIAAHIFYAEGDGVLSGTLGVRTLVESGTTARLGYFVGTSTGSVTIDGGTVSTGGKSLELAGSAKGTLTVNSGSLTSSNWIASFPDSTKGTLNYNGGTITAASHNAAITGSGTATITMTGGTLNAPTSFIYCNNESSTSTVTVTGGTYEGGYFCSNNGKLDVTVGGTASVTVTSGWAFRYDNNATGSVTLQGSAVVNANYSHGFVNNAKKQVDFTIKENASFTCSTQIAVYYCGTYDDTVTNHVNILGGTITAKKVAVSCDNKGGKMEINVKGGKLTSKESDTMNFLGHGSVTLKVEKGVFDAYNHGFYVGNNATSNVSFTATFTGGSFTAQIGDVLEVLNKNTIAASVTVSGGTFYGKHKDLSYGSGYPVLVNGQNSTLTIYGGTFLADYAHATVNVMNNATCTIYGGYFEGNALCCVRAADNGKLTIYGGDYYYSGTVGFVGQPVRSGTGSSAGTVHVYGGNFRSDGGDAVFRSVSSLSSITVHGGYNTFGGGALVGNSNTGGTGGTPTTGYAIGGITASDSIHMVEGAAVRIVQNSNGMRFKSVITAESLAYLNSIADAGSIKFGTLIAPLDYVQQVSCFTKAHLTAAGLSCIDLTAKDGLIETDDGGYEIRAAITNIKPANVGRTFAAVSYVTYTVNGVEVINYSTFRQAKNARSIEQVARIALQDGGRYNQNQLDVLAFYAPDGEAPVIDLYLIAGQSNAAGSSYFGEDFRQSNADFTNGYPNVYYTGTATAGQSWASKNYVEGELVKIGYGGESSKIGAELGMAIALSQYYNTESGRTAAIVKYGASGTSLVDSVSGYNGPEGSWTSPAWLKEHGKVSEQKSGGLYRAFVAQIESAINDYRAMGYDVNIVAAYWMQGESDVNDPALYAEMFTTWVADLRADVAAITGNEADRALPVLVGEISRSFDPSNVSVTKNDAFIAMQNSLANSIDNLYVIPQSKLASSNTRSDGAHWSCDDMLLIGQMVATTALNRLVLGENDTKYPMPYLVGTPVAEVYDASNNLLGSYSSFSWAIGTAPAGATVKLLSDLTLYGSLGINNSNAITVDGCNYKIDVKSKSADAMKLIATNLTLKDFYLKNHTKEWGIQTYQNATLTWNGGSFEAESIGIVINDAATVALNGVNVTVTNATDNFGAIYISNNYIASAQKPTSYATLTVNGGSITSDGKSQAICADANARITLSGNAVLTAGTEASYVVSQKGTNGSLSIDGSVTVNGNVQNKGSGYQP